MTRACLIPARGGSTRIPRKNLRPFHGKPIIVYSIECALASGLFDSGVWVSTEDPRIARVAWDAGAKVHLRQPHLAENDVGTQQVVRAAILELWPTEDARPAITCCIYPTAPLLTVQDLKRGLEALVEGPTPYAYSVGPNGQDAGAFYWGLASAFVNNVPLHHHQTKRVRLPAERVCDINVEADWIRAEQLYAAMHKEETAP